MPNSSNMTELTQEQRLQNVLDQGSFIARYFEKANGHYRAHVHGICPTEGNDWGGFSLELSATGETLEKAQENLEALCKEKCVPGFRIKGWREQEYCPVAFGHHIGQTCGVCGQKD